MSFSAWKPSHDLDRLQILMDVSGTGTSGYQAADWLREHKQTDLGMSDHRRMLATMSFADDKSSGERLLDALWAWRKAANDFDPPAPIHLPSPNEIELESIQLPRDAFFGAVEVVPAEKASGQHRRRADHAVSARHPGGGPRRAAQRRGDRLPSLRPGCGDERARRRRHVPRRPSGWSRVPDTPGFASRGSGNITDG